MILLTRGASSLDKFSQMLARGFEKLEGDKTPFELIQIHGSPHSRIEDLKILKDALATPTPKIFLIHRPDELLFYPELKRFFDSSFKYPIVFLGDLVLEDPFWKIFKSQIHVIPHPYMDLTLPKKIEGKYVVGSFTSWREMRKLEHLVALAEALESPEIIFMAGGTGVTEADLKGTKIIYAEEFFVPHFNVQLYHLNGKKRLGESSGSLHRGVSIPVIFEANGMERTEGIKVVKIEADGDLVKIDYKKAADEILEIVECGVENQIENNLLKASENSPEAFARKIIFSLKNS